MSDDRPTNGVSKIVVGIVHMWPVFAGLIAFFVAYIELRTSAQISRAIKDEAVSKVEWDVRRQATEAIVVDLKAKIAEAQNLGAQSDKALERRLQQLETQMETVRERQNRVLDRLKINP